MGYVPSIKAENLHSRTYGDLTRIIKANDELRKKEGDQFYGMIKENQNGSLLDQKIEQKLKQRQTRLE